MALTVVLPPEIESRLYHLAAQAGRSVEDYLAELVEKQRPSVNGPTNGAGIANISLDDDEDEGDRPWRGVLVLPRHRVEVFTGTFPLQAHALPRRASRVNMAWHKVEVEDAGSVV